MLRDLNQAYITDYYEQTLLGTKSAAPDGIT